jgi:hypothetical protein
MTQTERLHEWLKERPIDPMTAWDRLGIYRLAARVNDLRNRGVNITSDTYQIKNRFGETVKVARYWLKK